MSMNRPSREPLSLVQEPLILLQAAYEEIRNTAEPRTESIHDPTAEHLLIDKVYLTIWAGKIRDDSISVPYRGKQP